MKRGLFIPPRDLSGTPSCFTPATQAKFKILISHCEQSAASQGDILGTLRSETRRL